MKTVIVLIAAALLALPCSAQAAIARVGTAVCGSVGFASSLTYAFNSGAGSNPLMFVSVQTGGQVPSSVTYAAAAMTLVDSQTNTYLYAKAAPASGSNNVVVTLPSGDAINSCAFAYSGAQQSTTMDSKNKGSSVFVTDFTLSTTVVASNSWTVFVNTNASGAAASAGSGSSFLINQSGLSNFDSNGTVSVGSVSMTATRGAATNWDGVIASFTEAGGGGGGGGGSGMRPAWIGIPR